MTDDNVAKTIIDALVDDLEDNAGLPPHTTAKYRRPRFILPEDCPLLVVWLDAEWPNPKTTHWFDSRVVVGISWHEQTIEEVETLVNNEETALSLMTAIARIKKRVRVLSREGLAGTWQVLPSEVRYLASELQQGLTEGYALAVEARITEE